MVKTVKHKDQLELNLNDRQQHLMAKLDKRPLGSDESYNITFGALFKRLSLEIRCHDLGGVSWEHIDYISEEEAIWLLQIQKKHQIHEHLDAISRYRNRNKRANVS